MTQISVAIIYLTALSTKFAANSSVDKSLCKVYKCQSWTVADHIIYFKICQWMDTVHPLFNSYTDVKCVAV